jgi:spore germination cell wall hydrolase CwlJ-like protein
MKKLLIIFGLFLSCSVFAQVKYTYNQNELVATCLILEASNQGKIGLEAVYEVILNRQNKSHKSLSEIVLQPKQFSCFNSKDSKTLILKAKQDKNFETALEIVKNNKNEWTVKGATFYYADYIPKPYWANGMTVTRKIGVHIFLK